MQEQDRKKQLADLTGCLKCRCPGFQVMTRVECRGVEGVRFCYFACSDPSRPDQETRHPVGEPFNCRCALGHKLDPVSVRFFEDAEAPWGFARCLKVSEKETVPKPRREASVWPVALGLGALLWFVTTQGR